jgi:drug/metabolite transporter (DMT)-like permease
MSALALVLLSAAAHAVWNGMLKRSADPAAAAVGIVAGAAGLSLALAAATGQASLPRAAWLPTLVAGGVEAAYFALLSGALLRLPLGTAYGLSRGGGLLLTWPVSLLLLGERIDAVGALGAGLVAAGLLALVRGRPGPGVRWALACAVAIGLYPPAYQWALRAGAPAAMLFACSLLVSGPLQVAALGGERRARLGRALREERRLLLVGALLCAASFLLFLAALDRSGAGWASALRNTSVLFAAAIGWARGEERTPRALGSAGLIALGAVALAGRG